MSRQLKPPGIFCGSPAAFPGLAALLDVSLVEAAKNVVPVARTAAESIAKLRQWANGRCLNAESPGGIYVPAGLPGAKPGRKVQREPSNNCSAPSAMVG